MGDFYPNEPLKALSGKERIDMLNSGVGKGSLIDINTILKSLIHFTFANLSQDCM